MSSNESRPFTVDQGAATKNPAGVPTLHSPATAKGNATDEFDAFQDLTRKLVQVPKSDVDEKRQKS